MNVRASLSKEFGIDIPPSTIFIGGMHNTTADTIAFYDVEQLPSAHANGLAEVTAVLQRAAGENALERCRRFLLAESVHTPADALRHVKTRSSDSAEVRPELNHATNAAVVIGRRALTYGKFLDRRVFLPSYDPLADVDVGTNLEHVLAPALVVCSGINLEYLFSTIDADHHGAGTKAPLNIVGNIGVLQGTTGDLRLGLPSQMTEFHVPVRALFVVEAPLARVRAVLDRRADLRHIVHNQWVRFIVKDPNTQTYYRHEKNGVFEIIDESLSAQPPPSDDSGSVHQHLRFGLEVAHTEDLAYRAATTAMLASAIGCIAAFGSTAMNPYGAFIAAAGTSLALPGLAFSRRYLHGEFMFRRIMALTAGLLLGFNLVATAPSLHAALNGWSLFGFCSTFLIGSYNDRPTVRNNATYSFAAYRVADFALLTATALASTNVIEHPSVIAGSLLLAALFKSSQFPLTSLFARSMEGPTPASALGYAGLSAHVGVVLLASTMNLWFPLDWARITLGSVGLFTAGYASLIAKIRADRKGSIAYATSATIGLIYTMLAMGYPGLALAASFGHASFRMIQTLRAPSMMADTAFLRKALGKAPWPRVVPPALFRAAWRLRRLDSDFHLINIMHRASRYLKLPSTWRPSKGTQIALTTTGVVIAGAPFTPISQVLDEVLMDLIPHHPVLAGAIMATHFTLSVLTVRFIFLNVLRKSRFKNRWIN